MAIRYNKAYNKQIRDTVKHARDVQKTLERHGVKLGYRVPKVSELKQKYRTRRELNKELSLLKKLSSSDDKLLQQVETTGGATAIKWDFEYLKQNAENAIKYYKWEKKLELSKNPVYPHEKERLNEIEENLDYLQMEVDYMNQDQFNAYKGAINDYFKMQEHMKRGYRGFLYQVENAMRITGFSDEDINSFFNELKKLNPSEFHEWYRTNNNVKRIYELIPSPPHTKNKLTTSTEDAEDIIGDLLRTHKEDIARIKANQKEQQ